MILLTPFKAASPGHAAVAIKAKELIAYDQRLGFTRIWLCGRKQLDVKEGTDQIDRLVRQAASQFSTFCN